MATALITGARGQVGRRVVDRLVPAGWDARGFDLRSGDNVRDHDAAGRWRVSTTARPAITE